MARAATSPELTLYRAPGKKTKLRAAIFSPTTIFSARINQTFTTFDGILEITYDTPTGTYTDALPDMTVLVGSSAGAHDTGICRLRSIDGSKFYINETSDISWANDLYLTVIDDFGLWAKHVLIDDGEPFMDGGIEYSDQHTDFDPVPIMGSHRVLKLTGATVSANFNGASSYVVDGSAISAYAWTCTTASASSGTTTATPSFTFNSAGWHTVYLTLTAANGKTFFGVRYVYVWSDDNPPSPVSVETARQDADAGGWEFGITLLQDAALSDVRDRALVILFAEDWFGDTAGSIGPVAGAENIVCMGWIAEESINWNPEQGAVSFNVAGAHHWFQVIPSYPDGVEFTAATPTAWTSMQNLTVRLGLWHFLHWRTTATRIMDVFLTNDTKLSKEVSSLASNLWEQIREMAFAQIYARAIVNAHGQLYIEVHPQLVPVADRTWPTVMTITKADWHGEIIFDRITRPEVAAVTLSGVAVNASGNGTPYFSISPGRTYPHYGVPDLQDNLLVASQSQLNTLAGLYRSWRNNQYPDIPIPFSADIRLIDCAPRQKCAIVIDAADTPRGNAYSGNLIPKAITLQYDADTGHLYREVTFEAETLQGLAVTHVVPGEGDRSVPPVPPLPPLPDFPIIIPGGPGTGSPGGPSRVLFLDAAGGLIYTSNFDAAQPDYIQVNAGLGTIPYPSGTYPTGLLKDQTIYQLISRFFVTPSGAVYAMREQSVGATAWSDGDRYFVLAYAPSVGSTFTIIMDRLTATTPAFGEQRALGVVAHNPLVAESVMYISEEADSVWTIKMGAAGTYAVTETSDSANLSSGAGSGTNQGLSYGFGKWVLTGFNRWRTIAAAGTLATGWTTLTGMDLTDSSAYPSTLNAGGSGRTIHRYNRFGFEPGVIVGENSLTTHVINNTLMSPNLPWDGMACDPTGTLLMSQGLGGKAKSSDSGASWATLPSLPVGTWSFAYAGGASASSRWLAVGATIRYSDDFGGTWVNKDSASLLAINPTPNIIGAQVLEF